MDPQIEIKNYLESLPDSKRADMVTLHQRMLEVLPGCKQWFLDGRDSNGKVVSNPNIGYGLLNLNYANGKTKEFYQIGLSANTTGISVYVMGLEDKNYLRATYEKSIGKASVTGYCIKFKSLKEINLNILEAAIRDGVEQTKQ